ncbi:MAG: hypothetical protein KA758_08260 [Acidimicrobiales bacterium]|nr:hypothetical protein [Acidimicrobiales bacterium]
MVTRQRIVVTDHGTGCGEELARALGLSETAAERVISEAPAVGEPAPPVVELDPIEVTLRPDDDDAVVDTDVAGLRGFVGSRRQRTTLPDTLLGRITRVRLDAEEVHPRLHGGAVADEAGRAVLVLGMSGAGKSTLVACLAASGCGLINDEQVSLLREPGLVTGFTRPVAVKPGGDEHLPPQVRARVATVEHTQLVTAETLGTDHRLTGQPVLVVLPERRDDAEGVTWEALDSAEAVEALCANNLDLVTRPAEGLSAFAWLACTVPVVRLRYQHVAEAVPVVRALLADPPPVDAVVWQLIPGPTPPAAPVDVATDAEMPQTAATDAVVRAGDGVLTLRMGEEAVLFDPVSRHLAVLNPTGAALWASLPWPDLPVDDDELAPVAEFALELADRGLVALAGPPATSYRRVPGLVHRRIRDRVLVSDPDHRISTLQGASAVVWDELATPGTLLDLVQRTKADAGDDPEVGDDADMDSDERVGILSLARQVDAALRVLAAEGLIEPSST